MIRVECSHGLILFFMKSEAVHLQPLLAQLWPDAHHRVRLGQSVPVLRALLEDMQFERNTSFLQTIGKGLAVLYGYRGVVYCMHQKRARRFLCHMLLVGQQLYQLWGWRFAEQARA